MKRLAIISSLVAAVVLLGGCRIKLDNSYSRYNFVVDINSSASSIVLDADNASETALDIDWTPAHDYGDDYVVTYTYKISVDGSTAQSISEYEDNEEFFRSYTHGELQTMLTSGHFEMPTSTWCSVKFTVTASFAGPGVIIPDEASVTVKVKTYGAKQFAAEEVYMAGSAVGSMTKLTSTSSTYVWKGELSEGELYFPVYYGDEFNAIVPASGRPVVDGTSQAAAIVDLGQRGTAWRIPEAGEYRIILNFTTRTLTVISTADLMEVDNMYICGSALDEEVEITRTLEDENVFAWKGEMKAGDFYLALEFEGSRENILVPSSGTDINDNQVKSYAQASSAFASSRHWTVPAAGTYRIVVDITAKTIIIRSEATDLANKKVTYNNTSIGNGNYEQEVTALWMYGTFNAFAHDTGLFNGFQEQYSLKQSLANPYVFVYKGEVLPRKTAELQYALNGTKQVAGAVVFFIDNFNNNMWAWGSTADAKRNDHSGATNPVLGVSEGVVAGQSDNRYAYFIIPENCNYVEVDIDKLTVVFDNRE